MEIPLLKDIVMILGIAIVVILIFQKAKVPPLLGFLFAGIIAGPYGLNLVSSSHEVELLSEIGIIFLLFVIGIEFSLKELASIKRTVMLGGSLQVGGTIAFTTLLCHLGGMQINNAVFIGFLLSLSSTAIVLKLIQEKGEVTAPHGRISVAILIFQDIIVVPMMLFTPLLSGQADNVLQTVGILTGKVLIVIVAIYILAKYLVPFIFKYVVRTKNRELFLLTVMVFCFATALLTSSIGLSLALGAFFSGLIISESDYSHQATANVLPFREIFISFFFISVGFLLDIHFFIENIALILAFTAAVVLMKMLVIGLSVLALGYPPRTIFLTLFHIFQVGEFSLLLSKVGRENGLVPDDTYQYFLSVAILSMALTPFLVAAAPRFSDYLIKAPLPKAVRKRLKSSKEKKTEASPLNESLHDHLLIIGYGVNGENIAKAAKYSRIPYVILELDPDVFKTAKSKGEPIIFGDAADETILKHVHVFDARVIVIAISDPAATKKIVRSIRTFTKTACVIVRTRYVKEIEENLRLGADEVIPEEFETSIEIFSRVMKKYLVPTEEIHDFIYQLRSSDYQILTMPEGIKTKTTALHAYVPEAEIITVQVNQEDNKVVGKTIAEAGIRQNFGVTVLAIKRDGKFLTNVSPETVILQDDLIFLFGNPNDIHQLNKLFV